MKVEVEDLHLLATLAGQHPQLKAFLQARLDGYVNQLLSVSDETTLRNAQGRAAELRDLIRLLNDARGTLQKIQQTR